MPPFMFNSSEQRPADATAGRLWRKFTYLEYIAGSPDWESCLSWVQRCRFAWEQPPGFELFEGQVACLGVDRLGLEPAEVRKLLVAVAGEGARVPGASLILRVARPWHAVFEPAGYQPLSLPTHWLAGLLFQNDPACHWIPGYDSGVLREGNGKRALPIQRH